MINGAPTDNNAKLFKQGAHSVIDSSGFKVAKEYDTPDWTPAKAQSEMDQAISALGKNGFVGVYAANDGTASGAIASMKGAGIDPSTRPVTGQDAELAGIQRILVGDQYMTVYKPIKPLAEDRRGSRRARSPRVRSPPATNTTENNGTDRRADGEAAGDAGHGRQGQGHGRRGRLLEGQRDLHRQVRRRLQEVRNPVGRET